jgi:CHRD domain
MLKLLRLFVVLAAAAALALVMSPTANAQARERLVVPLSAECEAAEPSGATGIAFVDVNAGTGRITYYVVAFNLPGTITAAHIHGPALVPGGNAGVAVLLDLTGANSGVVASGEATDHADAKLIADNPENFYFNVHTTECPGGALRGSLG